MKPITLNIIFLVVAGALIISVGSLTYTFSSQKEINLGQKQISTSTQSTKTNSQDLDDNYEDADDSPSVSTTKTPSPSTTPTNSAKSYTASDVASHNNQSSCWTIVNGNIYDLTSYINSHPGGQRAIDSICGVNGTGAFDNQHGGASKPEKVLQSFLIGPLK
jgi:cytochrome b involved in lipid metabolism